MAGIGLINLDLDAKTIEPIAILAGASVVGYFIYKYLSQQQADNAAQASALADATGPSNAYAEAQQYSLLSALLGGGETTTNAQGSVTTQSGQTTTTGTGGVNTTGGSQGATIIAATASSQLNGAAPGGV